MGTLLAYSLIASLVAAALYPVARTLAARCTCYSFVRHALLAALALILALPLLFMPRSADISGASVLASEISVVHTGQTAVAISSANHWPAVSLAVYFGGALLLLLFEALSYVRLAAVIAASRKGVIGGHKVYITDAEGISPFSWGRMTVIPAGMEDDTAILRHELSHTRHRHWLDTLLCDAACILLWYNPFIYQYRRLIKMNHEYEADRDVIASGADADAYCRLLVEKAIGRRTLAVADNFSSNMADFRRRVMAVGQPSSRRHMRRALFALPALTAVAVLLAFPVSAGIVRSVSGFAFPNEEPAPILTAEKPTEETTIEEEEPLILDTPLENPEGLLNYLSATLSGIGSDTPMNVQVNITVDETGRISSVTTDESGNQPIKTVIEEATNSIILKPAFDNGHPVEIRYSIPVRIQ